MKHFVTAGVALWALAGIASAGETPVWQQFVEAKRTGAEPILPDFSYSGYKRGEVPIPDVEGTVFDVTKYGAVPDDGKSDHAAIVATIAAAKEAGGGIVFFPPGEFLTATDPATEKTIRIDFGNVVLRGSGSFEGGTVIRMVKNYEPTNPEQMYSVPFLFLVKKNGAAQYEYAKVTESARRETMSVTVDSAAKLHVGQFVTLYLKSKEAAPEFFEPYTVDPIFKRVVEGGVLVTERHRIAAIDGNTVKFHEPIHTNVNAQHPWKLMSYEPLENVGVEDICFAGEWTQEFVHHRSAMDDSGWSILRIEGVADGWVRRCNFVDTNQALHFRDCLNVSVLHVIMYGNAGHFGMHTRAGYGVWGGLMEDRAWFHHGPSVGYQGVSSVYWRCEMQPEQRNDSHSGLPYATLLDCLNGGILWGSGGPIEGMPNHLGHYTLWNFNHRGKSRREYDFWREGQKERFLKPLIVGLHGEEVRFNESTLGLLESYGKKVEPESLWEAQLALRLGALPQWVTDARADWEKYREGKLVAPRRRAENAAPKTHEENPNDE